MYLLNEYIITSTPRSNGLCIWCINKTKTILIIYYGLKIKSRYNILIL